MPKSRKPYPPEYRAEIVRLVRAGRSIEQLSREFEPSHQTIRNWARQADIDDNQENGLTTREREELRRLRKENRVLREEKEILAKAAAWGAGDICSAHPFRSARLSSLPIWVRPYGQLPRCRTPSAHHPASTTRALDQSRRNSSANRKT